MVYGTAAGAAGIPISRHLALFGTAFPGAPLAPNTVRALGKEGMTMIIVTHQMGFAKEMADRVIFMEAGCFVAQGSLEDFFANQMEHDRIKSFLTRIL